VFGFFCIVYPCCCTCVCSYYLFDLYLLHKEQHGVKGLVLDSMFYHHVVAIFSSLFFFIHHGGHVHSQVYGWNEVAPALHKLARFIPRNHPWRRPYQVCYLLCYCITYALLMCYILTRKIEYVYDPNQEYPFLWHNNALLVMTYTLAAVELYWLVESARTARWVMKVFLEERRVGQKVGTTQTLTQQENFVKINETVSCQM